MLLLSSALLDILHSVEILFVIKMVQYLVWLVTVKIGLKKSLQKNGICMYFKLTYINVNSFAHHLI